MYKQDDFLRLKNEILNSRNIVIITKKENGVLSLVQDMVKSLKKTFVVMEPKEQVDLQTLQNAILDKDVVIVDDADRFNKMYYTLILNLLEKMNKQAIVTLHRTSKENVAKFTEKTVVLDLKPDLETMVRGIQEISPGLDSKIVRFYREIKKRELNGDKMPAIVVDDLVQMQKISKKTGLKAAAEQVIDKYPSWFHKPMKEAVELAGIKK